MSADELNTLRAEAATAAAETAAAEAVADTPPPPDVAPVDEGFAHVLGTAASGVGNILCRRLNVTGLDEDEAASLGAALERLVAAYDIGPRDPKGQAWMGFGLVMLGVIGNRRALPPKDEGEGVNPPPDMAPAPPAFGVPVNQSLAVTNP